MNVVCRALLLVCALALSTETTAWAAKARDTKKGKKPAQVKWVVLLNSDGALPEGWAVKLRQAAEAAAPERAWVEPPSLGQEDLLLTLGCATWGPQCAGKAAGVIGADNALLIGTVVKDVVTITVGAVTAAGAVVGEAERVEASADGAGLALAEAWISGAVKGARPTVLVIASDLPGSEVLIDGVSVGTTPLTLIDSIDPGEHTLGLRREGRAPLTRTIVVAIGTVNREFGALAAGPPMRAEPKVGETPPAPLPPPPPGGPAPLALAGYGLAGVGVIGVAAGVAFGASALGRRGEIVENFAGGVRIKPGGVCALNDGSYAGAGASGCTPVVARPADGERSLEEEGQAILDYTNGLLGTANVAFVLAGASVLVAATGLSLALATPESKDEAAAAPSPAPPSPAPAPAEPVQGGSEPSTESNDFLR